LATKIDDFTKAYANRHSLAWQWKKEGKKVFGYLYAITPEELIHAAGIIPVQLTESEDAEDLRQGKIDMPECFCSFSLSCAGQGMSGVYNYLDGVIFNDSCTQSKTVFEVWEERFTPPFFHYLMIPDEKDESTLTFYVAQLKDLKGRIEKFTGHEITEESLKKSIDIYNENRRLVKKLYELRTADNPPISGSQVFEIMKAGLVIPKEMHNQMLKELLDEIPSWPGREAADRPRVMVWTHVFEECCGKAYPNFIRMTEDLGGEVVGDEFHRGVRYYDGIVEIQSDPLEAIGKRYLGEVPHSFKIPVQPRIDNIMESIEKYRIEGIIFFVPKYCQTDWFHQYLIEKALKEKGLPYLTVETSAAMPAAPVRTRIEAFLEMISM
jgi:bcr-type benzoyl-CoA reductase subunit C